MLDYVIDLARRSGHRVMLRLVKGAYWDAEIKRAQVDGLEDFPVSTRKLHTDISYIACARKLLAATERCFRSLPPTTRIRLRPSIISPVPASAWALRIPMPAWHGRALYEEVVLKEQLHRPCRIYAPVGTHETLLPIWFGACWKTAPTPPSFIGLPIRMCRSTNSWRIRRRRSARCRCQERLMIGSSCQPTSSDRHGGTRQASIWPMSWPWPNFRTHCSRAHVCLGVPSRCWPARLQQVLHGTCTIRVITPTSLAR